MDSRETGCEDGRWMELAQDDMVQMGNNRIPSRESNEYTE
jgi:hypothetical protein